MMMRRFGDIEGGFVARLRWLLGGPFRVLKRTGAPLSRQLRSAGAAWRERSTLAASERRWRRLVRRALKTPVAVETLAGSVSRTSLPVIVCLWNRPERIDDILSQLGSQDASSRMRLMLWNNDPQHDEHYRRRIAEFAGSGTLGAIESIEFHSSVENIGGFARFFMARRALSDGTKSPLFVMLDDDQNVTPHFVADLLRGAETRSYAGVWAWKYTADTHWDREPAEPGESADYVGTGGSICDLAIANDHRFFTRLPPQFAFLEDQWLSAYALAQGWRLRKIETPVEFVLHESNQFHSLAERKNEFRRYLATDRVRRSLAR